MGFVVIGAGGHAKVVVSTIKACGLDVEAVLDDDEARFGTECGGVAVTGPIEREMERLNGRPCVVAIGANEVRKKLAETYPGANWTCVVHPFSFVDPGTLIGAGSVVFAGSVVQPGAQIGSHVILNTGCSVDHDGAVADFAQLAPGVRLGGDVTVGTGAFLGLGSTVNQGLHVGDWSLVGAGAAVVCDVSEHSKVLGVPARPRGES